MVTVGSVELALFAANRTLLLSKSFQVPKAYTIQGTVHLFSNSRTRAGLPI